MPDVSSGARAAIAVAATPLLGAVTVLLMIGGAGANAAPPSTGCGGAGTGQTIAGITLDAEQMGNAQTIVSTTAARRLPSIAAVIAVDTAYTESTLHNSAMQTDHDSEGLFQQRIAIYTAVVADDPVKATNAFLDRLVKIQGWQSNPIGVDAQAVQRSAYPSRYQPNAALAEQIVGQLWASTAATTTSTSTSTAAADSAGPVGGSAAICAGGGGAVTGGTPAGDIVGPTGNNIAGTTTIPAGLTLSGTARGDKAARYALAQLGKPYVFGASGPAAFDCSGLTMAAWAAAGTTLPHLAAAQASAGTAEPTNLTQAVSGDLVLIPGSDGTAQEPGHVGIVAGYVNRTDGRHLYLVQAPETGVPIELTEATEWSGQIVAVRHIA